MKDTIVLKDGTAIEIESGASLQSIVIKFDSRKAMLETWEKITEKNLTEMLVKNGDGLTIGRYANLILERETSVVAVDGAVTTIYSLREKTSEERRLDALEAVQAVQDGAIKDLGTVTSVLAEQIGGIE